MGMDVYGLKPKTKVGEYFRNSVWCWHPLWDYCCELSPELTHSVQDGHSNSGDGLNAIDSRKLGFAIKESINCGAAEIYVTEYYCEINMLPDQTCFCVMLQKIDKPKDNLFFETNTNFSHDNNDFDSLQTFINHLNNKIFQIPDSQESLPNPECLSCSGTGMTKNFNTSYHINIENIQKFSDFLIECGGFQIC